MALGSGRGARPGRASRRRSSSDKSAEPGTASPCRFPSLILPRTCACLERGVLARDLHCAILERNFRAALGGQKRRDFLLPWPTAGEGSLAPPSSPRRSRPFPWPSCRSGASVASGRPHERGGECHGQDRRHRSRCSPFRRRPSPSGDRPSIGPRPWRDSRIGWPRRSVVTKPAFGMTTTTSLKDCTWPICRPLLKETVIQGCDDVDRREDHGGGLTR